VRHDRVRALAPGTEPARSAAMRDIRLFILGHLMLVAVAVLGSL
jgi:hypothetical protein